MTAIQCNEQHLETSVKGSKANHGLWTRERETQIGGWDPLKKRKLAYTVRKT